MFITSSIRFDYILFVTVAFHKMEMFTAVGAVTQMMIYDWDPRLSVTFCAFRKEMLVKKIITFTYHSGYFIGDV